MSGIIDKEEKYVPNHKIETEHFIINYNMVDKSCINDVLKVLEDSYSRITTSLNQKLEEKLVVEIQSNLKELHIALGFPGAPDWIRGGLGKGKIIIASPLNPPPGSNMDNVINTAVHEFVHVVISKINNDIPRWLDEGIASFEAKDNNQSWIISTIRDGLESGNIPSFNDLDTGENFEEFFNRDGYQYSYTIVESIVEIFGYDKLCRLIKSPENFEDIFGMTQEELQNTWNEYIKKNY